MCSQRISRYKYILVCISMVLTIAWQFIFGYTPGIFEPTLGLADSELMRLAFFIIMVLTPLCFIIAPKRIASTDGRLGLTLPLLLFVGSFMTALSADFPLLHSNIIAVAGTIVSTVAYLWIYMSLLNLVATSWKLRWVVFLGVITTACSHFLASTVLILVPVEFQPLALPAIAVALTVTYGLCQRQMRVPTGNSDLSASTRPLATVDLSSQGANFLQLVVLVLVTIVLRAISNNGLWGSGQHNTSGNPLLTIVLIFGVIAAFIPIAIFSFRAFMQPRTRMDVSLPFFVLLALLVLSLVLHNYEYYAYYGFFIEYYSQAFYLVLVVAVIRHTKLAPYRLNGAVSSASFAAILLWQYTLEGYNFNTQTIILLLIYLTLIIIAVFQFNGSGHTHASADKLDLSTSAQPVPPLQKSATNHILIPEILENPPPPPPITGLMLQNIAQRYGLTSRECEIFAFMANDRSNAFIQKQLHISAGTVHSHIKSVYRKTGVHSRKHLFELLEQEKASLQHGKGA